jgi:predicted RNA-binding protein Jag
MELENIKNLSYNFFEKLLIKIDEIIVIEEEIEVLNIKIKTPDSSLVIWYSGKNLEDIRLILKQIIKKNFWLSLNIHIEVNDYIEQKENKLLDFIKKKIELTKKTWKETILPFFNSYERKKIHNFVSALNDNQIWTKSVWEGKERRLHIFKKIDASTLDLDSIDI